MTEFSHSNTLHGNITRNEFVNLLETGLRVGEHRFARRAALSWQTQFPGDLYISLVQAKAFAAGSGSPAITLGFVQQLVTKDPYFLEAYQFGIEISSNNNLSIHNLLLDSYFAAGGQTTNAKVSQWSTGLHIARVMIAEGDLDTAESALLEVITENPPTPLPAITHLELLQAQSIHQFPENSLIQRKIIEHYHQRWPACLQISLMYADALMDSGEPEKGVELLHEVVSKDITAQVIRRLWGEQHPYLKLWPSKITGKLDVSIPASIANWFGWNLLEDRALTESTESQKNVNPVLAESKKSTGAGARSRPTTTNTQTGKKNQTIPTDPTSPREDYDDQPGSSAGEAKIEQISSAPMPEALLDTQAALEEAAARINRIELAQTEGRFPVYILLSSQENLIQQYGKSGYLKLASAMLKFQKVVDSRPNWRAITMYVDDPQSTTSIGLKPVSGSDPWAIKKLLTDLDYSLARSGEMVGAVLIVGGPKIIPFHLLPNPVDDLDAEIPSDNPYGCKDENYFVLEWPVGRLPGDASNDIRPLVAHLVSATNYQTLDRKVPNWFRKKWEWLQNIIRNFLNKETATQTSLGYTAAVWRKASEAAYAPLADRKPMLVSPPATTIEYRKIARTPRYAYFNLHGILDSADWFGHNDPVDPLDGPDYPVALKLSDIRSPSWAPHIVFSEACYGAWISDRTIDQAIPLRMLSLGTCAFVGSTGTAYGSVETPLIAADLLGNFFWKHLKQGTSVGESLRRAKIDLIQEMDQRQGYLDGEDQKTLIEFILFGDPMMNPAGVRRIPKEVLRPLEKPQIHTVCEKTEAGGVELPMTEETLRTVKRVVRQYLPGMGNAQVSINTIHQGCQGKGHNCPTAQLHLDQKSISTGDKQVIVISKRINNSTRTHFQYARLTLDQRGKIVKLSVSR